LHIAIILFFLLPVYYLCVLGIVITTTLFTVNTTTLFDATKLNPT